MKNGIKRLLEQIKESKPRGPEEKTEWGTSNVKHAYTDIDGIPCEENRVEKDKTNSAGGLAMERRCWMCGRNGSADPLDRHHIFNGSSRKLSEKYGAVVYLCHDRCHIFGPEAVHNNAENMLRLKQWGQHKVMTEQGWETADFIAAFGKNYL